MCGRVFQIFIVVSKETGPLLSRAMQMGNEQRFKLGEIVKSLKLGEGDRREGESGVGEYGIENVE